MIFLHRERDTHRHLTLSSVIPLESLHLKSVLSHLQQRAKNYNEICPGQEEITTVDDHSNVTSLNIHYGNYLLAIRTRVRVYLSDRYARDLIAYTFHRFLRFASPTTLFLRLSELQTG